MKHAAAFSFFHNASKFTITTLRGQGIQETNRVKVDKLLLLPPCHKVSILVNYSLPSDTSSPTQDASKLILIFRLLYRGGVSKSPYGRVTYRDAL